MFDDFAESMIEYIKAGDAYDYETFVTNCMGLGDSEKEMAAAILRYMSPITDDPNIKMRFKICVSELQKVDAYITYS